MNKYEMMCIFDPRVTTTADTNELVESILGNHGATIDKKDDMGTKKLAYEIQKRAEGHYWLYEFQMDAQKLTPLSNELLIKESLLRHMIIRRDA